jgi:hypothetical protein
MDRTQACAAAEMGHDNTTIGGSRAKDVGQNACDVLIGKAVKPVPPDALGGELARQRECRGDLSLRSGGVDYEGHWHWLLRFRPLSRSMTKS